MTETSTTTSQKMLVVDDDAIFRTRLLKALADRGISAFGAGSIDEAVATARDVHPQRAIVDLRIPGGSGLQVVRELMKLDSRTQIVVLTGYGSIATAVEAVRLGALDYMNKPADTEQILAAFEHNGDSTAHAPDAPPSLARVEWEHIQRILNECGGNISETARRLGIHRRSLQRKLAKFPPLE